MRCHSAASSAQSLPHLWISDSLLSEAFHRFARVSQSRTPQRRHGSNVPGPLEARRRLARRRMGMTTLGAGSGASPAGGEADMLFGFGFRRGAPIGVEFEKQRKYQPPSARPILAADRPVTNYSPHGWNWPEIGSDGLPWELEQERRQANLEDDRRLDEFLRLPEDHIKDCQARFEVLLATLVDTREVTDADVDPIMDVLRVIMKDLGGQSFIWLIQTLNTHVVSLHFWRRLAYTVKREAVHGNISPEELLSGFKLILNRSEWERIAFIFAQRLAKTNARETLLDVMECIASSDNHRTKTKTWLRLLRQVHPSIREGHESSASWTRTYRFLANHFQPSDEEVVEHFGKMRRTDFGHVLLKFYLPAWASEAETVLDDRENESTTVDYARFNQKYIPFMARHGDFKGTELQTDVAEHPKSSRNGDIQALVDSLLTPQGSLSLTQNGGSWSYPLIQLADILAKNEIPYARFLDEVFEVCMRTQDNNTSLNMLWRIQGMNHCGVPTALAGKLVRHFMASGDLHFAYFVFSKVPTLRLSQCSDLPVKLIEQGKTHGEKIFRMLTRSKDQDALPPEKREHRSLGISQSHVDLVHEVAYAFASSEHLSPRTALRRVWECYRFLRDSRAPLQPLLSRAMIKAGISRPLNERQRLSRTQVEYVISVVEKIEGQGVAREADKLVWDFWQSNLRRQRSQGTPPLAKGLEGQGRWYENKRQLWSKWGGRVFQPHQPRSRPDIDKVEVDKTDVVQDELPVASAERTMLETSLAVTCEDTESGIHSSLTEMKDVLGLFSHHPPRGNVEGTQDTDEYCINSSSAIDDPRVLKSSLPDLTTEDSMEPRSLDKI